MRHLVGLILALIMSAAIYLGAGWSSARIVAAHAAGTSLMSTSGALVLAALLGVGLFLGLLLAASFLSPLGSGLPGLVLLAWSGVYIASAHLALRAIPLSGQLQAAAGFRAMLTSGMLALLGAVMIVPMFMPSRWRGREPEDEFATPAEAELVH
jgi:hypothetical protein